MANESNTRMILDRFFIDVLDYDINEVKAEQNIQGRRADYVLSANDSDVIVVEAKKAGMALRVISKSFRLRPTGLILAFAGHYLLT